MGGKSKKNEWFCCNDVWVKPKENTAFSTNHVLPLEYGPWGEQKFQLLNTASGSYFMGKVLVYFTEIVAAVLAIISHLVVWYYCEEREMPSEMEVLPDKKELSEAR